MVSDIAITLQMYMFTKVVLPQLQLMNSILANKQKNMFIFFPYHELQCRSETHCVSSVSLLEHTSCSRGKKQSSWCCSVVNVEWNRDALTCPTNLILLEQGVSLLCCFDCFVSDPNERQWWHYTSKIHFSKTRKKKVIKWGIYYLK